MDANAAADRINRRRGLVGLSNSQDRPILPLQRCDHFLDMGERLADLVASGDHDAAGIEDAETSQRDLLRFQDDRHQPGTDLDIGRRGRRVRGKGVRPPPEQIAAGGKIERGPDRRQLVFAIGARLGWNLGAEGNSASEAGFHFPRINRGQHPALCDQLRLGLMNELVVVEAKEEQSDQWQCRRSGKRSKDDQPHGWPPFFAWASYHASGSHRPSLKPTP